MLPIRRALISVSDKSGLAAFARGLHELGIEILSTGGTAAFLEEKEIPVVRVSEATGFPEILDGRVKTLHPRIHGGILADRARAAHLGQLKEHGIIPIDLVAVNLYPFERTAAADDATYEEVVEMIDIGGPGMIRAAAKNHSGVAVVVRPEDYAEVLAALQESQGAVPEAMRRRLALEAFRHTAHYDRAIGEWLGEQLADGEDEADAAKAAQEASFPEQLEVGLEREMVPRYGENPHQRAAVYRHRDGAGLFGGMEQLQGKELSWNNLLDADAARKMVSQFSQPAVVIVKHNNPCGVGWGHQLKVAYERALATDPVSAFGSIIALNRPVNDAVAELMNKLFVEVVIAPGFKKDALARMAKKKARRLIKAPLFEPGAELDLRSVAGGMLAQEVDAREDDAETWTYPTQRQPTEEERQALELAWKVCRYVKSNAIVLANQHQTVGIGAGQMSRVDSCELAVKKAQLPTAGCAAASDAFFPFRDGLDALAQAGVTAVIQPGGSKRDGEVIAAADEHGIALVHTGTRHFRH
ncbi:MAG: bifunctional phosphoribosylaminoimidazolecarboxamide formyltransferase/IMP cyclohydrolase [Acidobacteriota bacterium]|nr:bifunctional phosphoribosylaminoimidazolecarboxamide formyltransferase/IMP cyclohydrolase [Acidobacteriota bacterium]